MSRTRILRALFGLTLFPMALGCSDPSGVSAQESAPRIESGSPSGTGIVDTGQELCYGAQAAIPCPQPGQAFFGQDAQETGLQPSYLDNGDGTVTDLNTGLMWMASPDLNRDGVIDAADKLTFDQAMAGVGASGLAGYTDWRLPSIKELYSLMDFRGRDPSGQEEAVTSSMVPFLDLTTFGFGYGDVSAGERVIDAQFATSTSYLSTTMGGNPTMFGVNFADGRIKGYPKGAMPGQPSGKLFYVLYVRGDPGYGVNQFQDNGDGTVTDLATGLMWDQNDSGEGMDWEEALAWAQARNDASYLGHADWRLPNAKELQSIVDYTRAPDVTHSPAIDPVFHTTEIVNEAGQVDWPAFWSGTTHVSSREPSGTYAAYVCFGRCMGFWNGAWTDVHGAGAQRSDPKTGDPGAWPYGHGPQGDAIRIDNFVRLVRDAG